VPEIPTIDQLAEMSEAEMIEFIEGLVETVTDDIADRVAAKLGQSVIPSSFPAEIGKWIRESARYGAMLWRHTIPMKGPTAIFAEYRFNPDGTFNLQFQDTNGCRFWDGTFRPADG
jgi:hypothetical protein